MFQNNQYQAMFFDFARYISVGSQVKLFLNSVQLCCIYSNVVIAILALSASVNGFFFLSSWFHGLSWFFEIPLEILQSWQSLSLHGYEVYRWCVILAACLCALYRLYLCFYMVTCTFNCLQYDGLGHAGLQWKLYSNSHSDIQTVFLISCCFPWSSINAMHGE